MPPATAEGSPQPRLVLVVGATGVLRPAVLECVRRGWNVIAVARSQPGLTALAHSAGPLVVPLALDVGDADAVARAGAGSVLRDPVDAAVVYDGFGTDAEGNAALDRLAPLVAGTTVRILTSRWFPGGTGAGPAVKGGPGPARWPQRPGRVHLLLGIRPAGACRRWHTPEEISAAALHALQQRADAVLGIPPAAGPEG